MCVTQPLRTMPSNRRLGQLEILRTARFLRTRHFDYFWVFLIQFAQLVTLNNLSNSVNLLIPLHRLANKVPRTPPYPNSSLDTVPDNSRLFKTVQDCSLNSSNSFSFTQLLSTGSCRELILPSKLLIKSLWFKSRFLPEVNSFAISNLAVERLLWVCIIRLVWNGRTLNCISIWNFKALFERTLKDQFGLRFGSN